MGKFLFLVICKYIRTLHPMLQLSLITWGLSQPEPFPNPKGSIGADRDQIKLNNLKNLENK